MTKTATQAISKPAAKRKARKRKPAAPAPKRSVSALARPITAPLARIPSLPERIETLLMQGDLTDLSVTERLQFYKGLCRSLGLNPLTRPFEYIVFTDRDQDEDQPQGTPKGKMVLYARADCAAQLRKIHKVGIGKDMRRRKESEFYIVEADAFIFEKGGIRTDTATGIVWLKKWKKKDGKANLVDLSGRDLANAMMKAETKAKRRVTFSITGLHILDESEIEDLTQLTYDVSESGRVIQIQQPAEQAALPSPSETAWEKRERESIEKLTPAQRAVVEDRMKRANPSNVEAKQEEPVYSGFSFRQLAGGSFEIEGLHSLKHEHREILKKFWAPHAKPPALICTPEDVGRLMSQFEKLNVKTRIVGDSE